MSSRKPRGEITRQICVTIPKKLVKQIDEYIRLHPHGNNRSQIVRAAVKEFFDRLSSGTNEVNHV